MARKIFSIITPTLNCGAKLERTISSVLAQNDELFEFLIVDGGSTDKTLDIVGKYSGKLEFVSEKDRGVYDAMNKGIEISSGAYLYFLGAGDCLRSNILEDIRKTMPRERNLTLLYGNVYLKDEERTYDGEFDDAKIARRNICHQAVFYERSIFDLLGKYDLKYSSLSDHVFNIRCFGDGRIRKTYLRDLVIADYEGQGVSQRGDANFNKDRLQIIRSNLGYVRYLLSGLEQLLNYPKMASQKLRLMIKASRSTGK